MLGACHRPPHPSTGRRTAPTPPTRSPRRSIRSRRRTSPRCRWRGRTTRGDARPEAARRSSATRSSSAACSTPPRRSSRCSRSTPPPASRTWVFDPFAGGRRQSALGVNRGVVYWEDEGGRDARILVGAGYSACSRSTRRPAGRSDASAARAASTCGTGSATGRSRSTCVANTPGTIYKDLLIHGHARRRGPGPVGAGPHPRLRRPHRRHRAGRSTPSRSPASTGHETWPADAWTRVGGANSWSGITVDDERGLVFLPTGSAAFDFWGGNRHGDNLYANSLLALKADDRRPRLALPVRAPRHLGSRSAAGARAGDGAARRPRDRRRWRRRPRPATSSCSIARPASRCFRSRSRRCRRPISRARSTAGRRSRCPVQAAGVLAAGVHRRPTSPTCHRRRRPACASAGSREARQQFGAAEHAGHDHLPRLRRRRRVGRIAAYDARLRAALRQRQRDAVDPAAW